MKLTTGQLFTVVAVIFIVVYAIQYNVLLSAFFFSVPNVGTEESEGEVKIWEEAMEEEEVEEMEMREQELEERVVMPKVIEDITDMQVFTRRQRRVNETCRSLGTNVSYGAITAYHMSRLRWLPEKNLVLCFVAKVGTSTLLHHLMEEAYPGLLTSVTSNEHVLAAKKLVPPASITSTDTQALLLRSRTVMSVRHPFVRIVSAFLDKVRNCGPPRNCDNITESDEKSFVGFIKMLTKVIPKPINLDLASPNTINRHWNPFYINCAPCDITYDYIIKLETFEQDIRFILRKFNFKEQTVSHRNVKSASNNTINFFKLLPRSLIIDLYERYKVDFEMFDYSVQEYLEL